MAEVPPTGDRLRQGKVVQTYDVKVEAVAVPDGADTLAQGERLVMDVAACTGCHGDDLGGQEFINNPAFGVIYTANLTPGEGGAGATFSDEDWVRAIRHGLDPDDKPLLVMPAQHFQHISDEDLGAMIAHLKTLEPVDNVWPEPKFGPLGYIFLLQEPIVLPASLLDHDAPSPAAIEPGVTAEYGAYLVELGTCADCHGKELNGSPPDPGMNIPSANLTPKGELVGWTEEDFAETMRTGVNPAGHELLCPMSDVVDIFDYSDDEVVAIFMYLQSLPPTDTGSRHHRADLQT